MAPSLDLCMCCMQHVILQSYKHNVHVPLVKHTTLKGTTLISWMYPLIVLLLSSSLMVEWMPENLQCGDRIAISPRAFLPLAAILWSTCRLHPIPCLLPEAVSSLAIHWTSWCRMYEGVCLLTTLIASCLVGPRICLACLSSARLSMAVFFSAIHLHLTGVTGTNLYNIIAYVTCTSWGLGSHTYTPADACAWETGSTRLSLRLCTCSMQFYSHTYVTYMYLQWSTPLWRDNTDLLNVPLDYAATRSSLMSDCLRMWR